MKVERINSGIAGLDDILGGGFPRNHIYLIEGDPGVGKTTLALQFLLDGAARGERSMYITLSETAAEINDIAKAHGWSLDNIALFELSALEQRLQLSSENTVFHPSEVELTETTRAVLDFVETIDPDRVVFDSLSELRLLAQSQLRYRREVLNLKQYFSMRRSTVVLLDDRTSDPADMQLQSLAHGVVSLQQLPPEYGGDRRRLRIVKMRGIPYQTGFHDFDITTGGLRVYRRLIAAEHHQPFERTQISSGLDTLDAMLGGGIDRGTSTLLLGPAGTGKSAVVAQYVSAAAKRDQRSVIFAFDELRSTAIARADALGMNISKYIASGHITIQQVDPAEMSPGALAYRIQELVRTQDVSIVVIDSLNGYLASMPAERHLYLQLHELLAYLGQLGVTTVMTMAQAGLVGLVQAPVEVSYVADTVVLLRYFESAGRVRKAISVVKKRSGRHEDTIRELTLASRQGVIVGEPLHKFSGVLTSAPTFLGAADDLTR